MTPEFVRKGAPSDLSALLGLSGIAAGGVLVWDCIGKVKLPIGRGTPRRHLTPPPRIQAPQVHLTSPC